MLVRVCRACACGSYRKPLSGQGIGRFFSSIVLFAKLHVSPEFEMHAKDKRACSKKPMCTGISRLKFKFKKHLFYLSSYLSCVHTGCLNNMQPITIDVDSDQDEDLQLKRKNTSPDAQKIGKNVPYVNADDSDTDKDEDLMYVSLYSTLCAHTLYAHTIHPHTPNSTSLLCTQHSNGASTSSFSTTATITMTSTTPTTTTSPPCEYGMSCYRQNPSHFQQYSHPPVRAKL